MKTKHWLIKHAGDFPDDPFLTGFLLCIFWQDDPVHTSGEYMDTERPRIMLDRTPGREIEKARTFCQSFLGKPGVMEDLDRYGLGSEQAGHDLVLSCNGAGSGFFDRVEDRCPDYDDLTTQAVDWGTVDNVPKRQACFAARDALVKTCNCAWHATQRLQDVARGMGTFQLSRYKGRNYFYP